MNLKAEEQNKHISHHIYDKQYGVRELGLTEMVIKLVEKIEKLEARKE